MTAERTREERAARWDKLLSGLRDELERATTEIETLTQIDGAMLDQRPLAELLNDVTYKVAEYLGAQLCTIMVRHGGELRVQNSNRPEYRNHRLELDDLGLAALESGHVETRDSLDALGGTLASWLRSVNPELTSTAIVRIDREQAPFAMILAAGYKQLKTGTSFLEDVARQLKIAIEHGEVLEAETMSARASVDQEFFGGEPMDPQRAARALEALAQPISTFPGLRDSSVQILFPDADDRLRIVYSSDPLDVGLAVDVGSSVSGRAWREQSVQTVTDVSQDPHYAAFLGEQIRAECAVPVSIGSSQIAILNVESSSHDSFDGYGAYALRRYAKKISFSLAFIRLHDELEADLQRRHADEIFVAMGMQTGNMVHRLNSVIGNIKARAQRLSRSFDDKDALEKRCNDIVDLADQALEEPERIKEMLSASPATDINQILELLRASQYSDTAPVEVIWSMAPALPRVDSFLISDMLQNLIDNAVTAAAENSDQRPPVVHVSSAKVTKAGASNRYVQVSVKDSGAGIPEDVADRLFAPKQSYTTYDPRQGGGLGLGLFLVHKVVMRLGGEISVSESTADGTRFDVLLPVAED